MLEVMAGPVCEPMRVTMQGLTVGRSSVCDLALRTDGLSRVHAKFLRTGNRVHVLDLESTHGTFVNAERVATARLRDGDQVQLGSALVLRLKYLRAGARAMNLHLPRLGGCTRLTDREMELVTLASRGMSNAELAASLAISRRTVTTHMTRIYAKLEVNTRAELVAALLTEQRDTHSS